MIAAVYRNERLLGTIFKELTKESYIMKMNDVLPTSFEDIVP